MMRISSSSAAARHVASIGSLLSLSTSSSYVRTTPSTTSSSSSFTARRHYASSRLLQSASVPVPTSTEEVAEAEGAAVDAEDDDWREPTLVDLDRSIPQVDCEFVSTLIKSRTARLVKHRKEQATIFDKVLRFKEEQAGHKRKDGQSTPPVAPREKKEEVATSNAGDSLTTTGVPSSVLNVNASNSPSAALLKSALDADGDEMVEKGVLTEEEWDVFAHSRPEYDDGYLLIDCRTVNEITSWGIIEGAKVLPAHEMYDAFKLTPDEFDEEFGFNKPHPSQKIIFYCQFGTRSLMAAQILSYLGYPNVLVLREGYHEWAKQYNLLLRRWTEHDKQSGNDLERRALFEAAKQLQREIAPEFNELPLMEAERLQIDETRSKGTMLVGEGLRALCIEEVEKLASGIDHDDLKLPPSLNDQVRQKLLDSPLFSSEDAIAKRQRSEGAGVGGASRATTGDFNQESSPLGMFNYMLQSTGMETGDVSSESRSPSAKVGMGGETPSVAETNKRLSNEESSLHKSSGAAKEDIFTSAYNDFSKEPSYISGDNIDFVERDAMVRRKREAAAAAAAGNEKK